MKTPDQIAAEAVIDFSNRNTHIISEWSKELLRTIIKAAIEEATDAERDDRISWQELYGKTNEQLDAEREKPYPRFKCLICKKGANELDSPHYLERVSATGKGAPALWLCTEHLNQQWGEELKRADKAAARAELAQNQLAAERARIKVLEDGTALNAVIETNKQLREQLAAEQRRAEFAEVDACELRKQLAAEREKRNEAERDYDCGNLAMENEQLREQLAAEREKVKELQDEIKQWQQSSLPA